jgi:hypothetical protein
VKKILFIACYIFITPNVYALVGVGDVVYDPSAATNFATMIKQAKETYEAAKSQLDKMVSMEKTIREAQEAYETLSKFDLNQAIKGMQNGGKLESFAALRGSIANTEGKVTQDKNFVSGNIERIGQLENLELLKRAQLSNMEDVNGKPNSATSAKVTAQSTAALALLAASEEQRRVKEEVSMSQANALESGNTINSAKIYDAIGK